MPPEPQAPPGSHEPHGAPSGSLLTLTRKAVEMVKASLQREGLRNHALRVGISGGGCSGMKYTLAFEEHPKEGDLILDCGGVRVMVDRASEPQLRGVVIDYVSGLHGAGFKFLNPNAQRSCGCGSSFSA